MKCSDSIFNITKPLAVIHQLLGLLHPCASLMVQYYAPLSGRYAVVRVNPIAAVERYGYPDIVAQAAAMPTKKYLIYLERVSLIDTNGCNRLTSSDITGTVYTVPAGRLLFPGGLYGRACATVRR